MVGRGVEIDSERIERALMSHFRGVRMCDCRADRYTKDGFVFTATGYSTPIVINENLEAVEHLTVELPSEVREAYLKYNYYVHCLNGWTIYVDRQFDIELESVDSTISHDVTSRKIEVWLATGRQKGNVSAESTLSSYGAGNYFSGSNSANLLIMEPLGDTGIRFLHSGSRNDILPESGGLVPITLGLFRIRIDISKNTLGQILIRELWIKLK